MPKILKVRDKLDSFKVKKKILPDISNRTIFVAKSGNGKSNLLVNLLLRKEPEFYNNDFQGDNIFLISPSAKCDDKLKILIESKEIPESNVFKVYDNDVLSTIYDLIKQEYMSFVSDKKKPPNFLIIIDDCAVNLKDGGRRGNILEKIFVNGRHYNCSCWTTTQYYTHLPSVVRTNANAIFLWNTSHKEFTKIAEEVSDYPNREFIDKMREQMTDKHSFVLVDFTKPREEQYKNSDFVSFKI